MLLELLQEKKFYIDPLHEMKPRESYDLSYSKIYFISMI